MARARYLLLLVPFVAFLYPPFYNRADPVVLGFPFFYWYQLVGVAVTGLLVGAVLLLGRARR